MVTAQNSIKRDFDVILMGSTGKFKLNITAESIINVVTFILTLDGDSSTSFINSGFTGQLVVDYLSKTYPTGLKWAIVGRDGEKLRSLHKSRNLSQSIGIIIADSSGLSFASILFITCSLSSVITFLFSYFSHFFDLQIKRLSMQLPLERRSSFPQQAHLRS